MFRRVAARSSRGKYEIAAECLLAAIVNYCTQSDIIIACIRIYTCVIESFLLFIPTGCSLAKLDSPFIVRLCLNIYEF